MKKLIFGSIAVLGIGLSGSSGATPITWQTETGSSSTSFSCGSGFGNTCTFNSGGEMLKARGYSTNNDSGTGDFEKAMLSVYSGGIGVRNPDAGNETSSPNHSIDNYGRDDFVVFEYEAANYSSTGFKIGWKRTIPIFEHGLVEEALRQAMISRARTSPILRASVSRNLLSTMWPSIH